MKKIVVSDLIGTIIPNSYLDEEYRYYMKDFDINRMYFHISNSLKQFLEEDNYLVIVSSPGSHGTVDYAFNQLTEPLYLQLKDYKDKVMFFTSMEKDCDTNFNRIYNVENIENVDGIKISKSI